MTEIMADLYCHGRQPDDKTAREIIDRLEAQNNYVPSSDSTRREYAHVLLTEYREYVEGKRGRTGK